MNRNNHEQLKDVPLIPIMLSLFLVSVSLFSFQVLMTRVFSPMLQYHFVFLVTSMAILGLGIGGIVVYYLKAKRTEESLAVQLPGWLVLLTASYVGVFVLVYKLPFAESFILYALLTAIPYVIGGIYVSAVFQLMAENSHKLYFADLLGSGIGSIAVVMFINQLGIVNTLLLTAGLTAAASLIMALFSKRRKQILAVGVVVLALGVAAGFQSQVRIYEKQFTGYFTSNLTSLARLRSSNTTHRIKDWSWDAYSRTDLLEIPGDSSMLVTIDGGSNSQMVKFDGDLSKVSSLKADLNYLPFETGKNDNVLLIGPGGGKDVVLALLGGSRKIDAVEISRGSIEMAKKYREYNGGIYDRDEVNVYIQDGRNFVKQKENQYDLIYLAQVMSGAAEGASYALTENFIYTKEAIKDYWKALKDGGRLSFILHSEQDLNRITLTMVEALKELGIPGEQIGKSILVVNRSMPGHQGMAPSIHMPTMIVGKRPFTQEEVTRLKGVIDQYMHIPLYLPYLKEDGTLAEFSAGGKSTREFYRVGSYNFIPTTDDRPFFFNYEAGVSGRLLILLIGTLLAAFAVFKPILGKRGLKRSPYYFMGLGAAYMLIEISLIQKFSLLLGYPTLSFIVTLVALLMGGGLGSLMGDRAVFKWNRRYLPLLIIPVLMVGVYLLTSGFMDQWIMTKLPVRILITAALLVPLGFFMGMPFPYGLQALKEQDKEEAVPLVWGVNGVMSVAGSVLSVIISMQFGFSYALLLGGVIYLFLFLAMPLLKVDGRVE